MSEPGSAVGVLPSDPSVPLFTIGTVSRRVGVSAPALRMWEERYGVVEPYREENGWRLYSEEQIDDLIWVRDAIENGLTAAEAHRMLETRRQTRPAEGATDALSAFRDWVLVDHEWLNSLCAEMVAHNEPVILAYLGVHDRGEPDSVGSWLLVSWLDPDRPSWFTGSAHSAARLHGDRLAAGASVSFTRGSGRDLITETATPIMLDGSWVGTVAVVTIDGDGGSVDVASMAERVGARYEAWAAFSKFDELTRPDSGADRPSGEGREPPGGGNSGREGAAPAS